MRKNEVTIVSIISSNNTLKEFEEIKISNQNMILVKIDFEDKEYWFWFNKVDENGYSIGVHNYSVNDAFYSEMFDILKVNRNEIEEAKIRILRLFKQHTNNKI